LVAIANDHFVGKKDGDGVLGEMVDEPFAVIHKCFSGKGLLTHGLIMFVSAKKINHFHLCESFLDEMFSTFKMNCRKFWF
jgi:hypothetical protein